MIVKTSVKTSLLAKRLEAEILSLADEKAGMLASIDKLNGSVIQRADKESELRMLNISISQVDDLVSQLKQKREVLEENLAEGITYVSVEFEL